MQNSRSSRLFWTYQSWECPTLCGEAAESSEQRVQTDAVQIHLQQMLFQWAMLLSDGEKTTKMQVGKWNSHVLTDLRAKADKEENPGLCGSKMLFVVDDISHQKTTFKRLLKSNANN